MTREVPPPCGPTPWPYSTPQGHIYDRPTSLEDVRGRHTDAVQGAVDGWGRSEMPPDPEWEFLVPLWDRIDELEREVEGLRTIHVRAMDLARWAERMTRAAESVREASSRHLQSDADESDTDECLEYEGHEDECEDDWIISGDDLGAG